MSANPRASMTVTSPPVSLSPGRAENVTVSIVNHGLQPDDFRLGVRGIEPAWVTFRPPTLALGPGEQGTITAVVQPPPNAVLSGAAPVLRLTARSSGTTIAEAPLATSMTGQAVTMNNMMTPAIGGAAGAPGGAARGGVARWLLPLFLVGALACVGILAVGGFLYARGTASTPTATIFVVRLTATVPALAGGTGEPDRGGERASHDRAHDRRRERDRHGGPRRQPCAVAAPLSRCLAVAVPPPPPHPRRSLRPHHRPLP